MGPIGPIDTRGGGAVATPVSHVDVLGRGWVETGASVWILRPDAVGGVETAREARLGEGEIVAFRVGDLGLRLWLRLPGPALTPDGCLRLSIKSVGPLLVGDAPTIDLPQVGVVFWLRPPMVWLAHERRRAFRTPVETYCQVWLDGVEEPFVRRVINLSTCGAAIEGVPARLGEALRLSLELGPVAPPVALRARVVRQESAAMGAHTALEFEADAAAQAVLLQYLLRVSARHLGSALRD